MDPLSFGSQADAEEEAQTVNQDSQASD